MAEIVEFTPKSQADFVLTPTAECILGLLQHCHRFGDIGFIVGNAGTGKTMALRHYAETADGVHYALLRHQHSRALGPMLHGLCEGFVLWHWMGDHIKEVIDRLEEWVCGLHDGLDYELENLRHLLVIDEAQYLSNNAIDVLRSIHDKSETRGGPGAAVGMVFAGNQVFGRNFAKAKAGALAPFASRLGPRLYLDKPEPADIAAICRARGIQGARELDLLQHYGKAGDLRVVDKIISTAARRSQGPTIRLIGLEDAVAFLGL